MNYLVRYTDTSGQTKEEWSYTEEQARWTAANLKRMNVADVHVYRLVEVSVP